MRSAAQSHCEIHLYDTEIIELKIQQFLVNSHLSIHGFCHMRAFQNTDCKFILEK